IDAIQYGKRIMRNTNGLIGRYPGADGMKTGFICSSGFNVVASARREGRHLIAVVMGSRSANERTMKTAELFDRGFSAFIGFGNPSLEQLPASPVTEPPDMRASICGRRGPAPGEDSSVTTAESGVPNLLGGGLMAFSGDASA